VNDTDREDAVTKGSAPLERRKRGGWGSVVNLKGVGLIGAVLATGGVGLWAAWGVHGEEEPKTVEAKINSVPFNAATARPMLPPPMATSAEPGALPPAAGRPEDRGGGRAPPPPKPPPPPVPRQNRPKSLVAAPGNWGSGATQATAVSQAQAGRARGRGMDDDGNDDGAAMGYSGDGEGMDDGDGHGGSLRSERRPSAPERGRAGKERFFRGEGMGGTALDVPGELLPEVGGCVLKSEEFIPVQAERFTSTALPGRIRVRIPQPVMGQHFLGNGRVEACEAIPAFSTMSLAINTAGTARGDTRVQACALRLDLNGGGRRVLGCQPSHGGDGAGGIEAGVDYDLTGLGAAILLDATMSVINSLGDLIAGIPGIALQVGGERVGAMGDEIIRQEFERPPTLTIEAGALFGIQLNADLSMPLRRRVR
jgi:type IV secretory pathway VirB10-like protein